MHGYLLQVGRAQNCPKNQKKKPQKPPRTSFLLVVGRRKRREIQFRSDCIEPKLHSTSELYFVSDLQMWLKVPLLIFIFWTSTMWLMYPKAVFFTSNIPPPTSVFFYDSTKWFQRMFFLRCISLLIISTRSLIFLRDICRPFRPNTRGRAVVCVCTNKPSLSICPILYTIHPILFICVVNVLYLKDEMPRVPRLEWTMFMCAIAVYFIRCVLMLCACHFVVWFFSHAFLVFSVWWYCRI